MKMLEKLAGLAALAALVVYALSCRPAWNGDGSKVAFTWYQEEKASGVAVHDVNTGKTRNLVTFSKEAGSLLQVSWWGDRVFVFGYRTGNLFGPRSKEGIFLVLQPGTGAIRAVRTLNVSEFEPSPMVPPVMDSHGRIWLSGMESERYGLLRIDPDLSEIHPTGPARTLVLEQGGGNIFYLDYPSDKHGDHPARVGLFDPDKETLNPLAELPEPEGGKVVPNLAAAPDGSFLCAATFGPKDRASLFVVSASDGTVRTLSLPPGAAGLGGMAVSKDNRALWIVYLPLEKEAERSKPGVQGKKVPAGRPRLLEVELSKGRVQRNIILPIHGKDRVDPGDNETLALQPALSPYGRRLAVGGAFFVDNKEEPTPLLLVDLASDPLEVRKIAPPPVEGMDREE